MNDRIEFSTFEKQIMAALLEAEREPTPACLDPEQMLDLIEQGEKHPRYAELQRHLDGCALCREEYAALYRTWREARNLPVESPVALRPARPETPKSTQTPAVSSRPPFAEWLRGLLAGVAKPSFAFGAALVAFLAWGGWQAWQTRTALLSAQELRRKDQATIADLSRNLNRARQDLQAKSMPTVSPNHEREKQLAQAQGDIQRLQAQLANEQNTRQQSERQNQETVARLAAQNKVLEQQALLAHNEEPSDFKLSPLANRVHQQVIAMRGDGDVLPARPMDTLRVETRPRFTWTFRDPSAPVTDCTVSVTTDQGVPVRVKHFDSKVEAWSMADDATKEGKPLPRNRVYHWDIRAKLSDGDTIRSSVAAFGIVSEPEASRIAQARRRYANQPEQLLAIYRRVGLTEDARQTYKTIGKSLNLPAGAGTP